MLEVRRLHGILSLWKPRGLTSHDCVMRIRRLLKTRKVGHTGTLDPDVEGVLPICIGEATKIIPYLDGKKVYIAHAHLGKATETEDDSGKVISEKPVEQSFTNDEIDAVLQTFTGQIIQVPPMYSAVRVKGKRLYEYARENISVERPQREVTIHSISRLEDKLVHDNEIRFKVVCSKGTYIRTLCVDIGKKLGYPAHMSFLERIESDFFQKEESVTFDEIEQAVLKDQQLELLYPLDKALSHLDTIQVTKQDKRRILHGQKLNKENYPVKTDLFLMKYEQTVLAIYKVDKKESHLIRPQRVFNVIKSEGEQT